MLFLRAVLRPVSSSVTSPLFRSQAEAMARRSDRSRRREFPRLVFLQMAMPLRRSLSPLTISCPAH
eukprot:259763-Alexandrium_andersonii.AAC.1